MDISGVVGLLVFFVALIASSVFLALRMQRIIGPALISTVFAAFLVQIISWLHLGYLEPFYQIALVFSLVIGVPISLVAAWLSLRQFRRSRQQ